ncbi:MAG: PAS domain S-box protein [Methanoregula sp.]
MFVIVSVFELFRDIFLPYVGIGQVSVLTIIVVSASAVFIASFPIRSLHNAESRLDTLMNGSPAPQFVIDADHRVILWNRALEISTGIKGSDVMGSTHPWYALYGGERPTLADLLVDGKVEQLPAYYKGKITKSKIMDGSYEVVDFFPNIGKDGSWFYLTASPVRDEKGTLLGAVETFIDVTDRVRAEEALEANRSLMEDSMELAHMAYWDLDVTAGMLVLNDRFYSLYGTTAEHEGGYRIPAQDYVKKFVHPDDAGIIQSKLSESMANEGSGTISELEHRIIRRDGKIRYIRSFVRTTRDETGRILRSHGANQDITERKQAEEALILSERTYHSYIDNSPQGLFVVDETGHYLDVNRAACILLGYSREEMLSMNILDLAAPEERQQRLDQFTGILEKLKTEPSVSFEINLKKKDGIACPVILSVVKLPNDTIMGFTLDITERKLAEEALKESEEGFLTFIKEASMRLKNPLEVVEGNLGSVIGDIDRGEMISPDITLQLHLQIKNLEQIRNNIIELNKAIVDRSGEISDASRKFLTE